jgi:hypothetical protein
MACISQAACLTRGKTSIVQHYGEAEFVNLQQIDGSRLTIMEVCLWNALRHRLPKEILTDSESVYFFPLQLTDKSSTFQLARRKDKRFLIEGQDLGIEL